MSEHIESEKIVRLLGLAARAGKLVYGTDMVCEALRVKKRILLVVESRDSSENTHKKITDKCNFYKVKHIRLDCDGSSLAAALGKTSSLGAVAVTDEKMSGMVEKYI